MLSRSELRRLTYVPSVDGCEGLYVTPTLQGSRPGGIVAQAWGTLLSVGEEGYVDFAKKYAQMVDHVKEILDSIPELELLVEPDCACVPIKSVEKSISIYQVATLLEKKGWNMFTGQNPPVMTVCLGEQHLRVLEKWGEDIKDAVALLRANPNIKLEETLPYTVLLPASLTTFWMLYCDHMLIFERVKPKE